MAFIGRMRLPEDKEYFPPEFKPRRLLLISGKRKCGKDHFYELLINKLNGEETATMRIAEPIKYYWTQTHNLDFQQMMGRGEYKETHRKHMVDWSVQVRAKNPGYFNVEAIRLANAVGKPYWICVDVRHKRDYFWFLQHYSQVVKRVRVTADEEVRRGRGWVWTPGVDDGPSECDLDDVTDWDLIVCSNDKPEDNLTQALNTVFHWFK